jgi:hypothetical protein
MRATSGFVTGRRNARRESAVTIFVAQASSCARFAGRQEKMRWRLGVLPGPVGLNGPATVNVSMCGRPVLS